MGGRGMGFGGQGHGHAEMQGALREFKRGVPSFGGAL